MKNYIVLAIMEVGSQKELADYLGVSSQQITNAKNGRAGLPIAVCCQIAQLLTINEMEVISASELITEKNQERRAVLLPFVSHAASVILGAVILNMTPAPANASELIGLDRNSLNSNVYYVKYKKKIMENSRAYEIHPKSAFQHEDSEELPYLGITTAPLHYQRLFHTGVFFFLD